MRRGVLFLEKYEFVLLILLVVLFLLLTLPGISWGAPDLWHPDEILRRVISALEGEWRFDETNFDYPSLPKYVMYGLGAVTHKLGYSTREFIIAARFLSVAFGAIVIVCTYRITRKLSGMVFPGIVAALLLITNPHFALNARWAHNDLYVTLFVTLSVYALLKYTSSENKFWLYGSFFAVGLAASGKYNGGSLLLAPVLIYLVPRITRFRKKYLEILETIFIGIALCILGYAIGTPKSALWFAYYFKRLIPALQRHSTYGKDPDSLMGILGQWGVLRSLLGLPFFIWGMLSYIASTVGLIQYRVKRKRWDPEQLGLMVVVVSILALDLPVLFSYNLQERFFLPMLPLFAILSAITLQKAIHWLTANGTRHGKTASLAALGITLSFNLLKVISVALLVQNDSRTIASAYTNTLPAGTRIEYTLYPPTVPKDHFSSAHNYPLFFVKFPGQKLPVSPFYEFNIGEEGVKDRKPDYIVLDSFTYTRFGDPNTCSVHPEDCDFFQRLRSGETNYDLIKRFSYTLPPYLPDPDVSFLNPDLEFYQRRE